jgi:hypothetical protein
MSRPSSRSRISQDHQPDQGFVVGSSLICCFGTPPSRGDDSNDDDCSVSSSLVESIPDRMGGLFKAKVVNELVVDARDAGVGQEEGRFMCFP